MSVTWILKIYCNLIRTGEAENDWGEYFKFQEMVLKQIRGINNELDITRNKRNYKKQNKTM